MLGRVESTFEKTLGRVESSKPTLGRVESTFEKMSGRVESTFEKNTVPVRLTLL